MNVELDDYTAQQLQRLAALKGEPDLDRLANELIFAPLAEALTRSQRVSDARRVAAANRMQADRG